MKSLIVIHILLLALGLVLGFFATFESVNPQSQWISLLYQLLKTTLSVLAFFSFLIFITKSTHVQTLFWFSYLVAVFFSALGLGLILQSIFNGKISPDYFAPLVASIGYFIALIAVYKLKKWRHNETF